MSRIEIGQDLTLLILDKSRSQKTDRVGDEEREERERERSKTEEGCWKYKVSRRMRYRVDPGEAKETSAEPHQ